MKGIDLAAAEEKPRRPIHLVQDVAGRRGRSREVSLAGGTRAFDQSRFAQNALDGRKRRDAAQQPRSFQFKLNGARADQPDFAPHQALTRLDHQTASWLLVAVRRSVWAE